MSASPLYAGMYRYADENGNVRLTNIPPSAKGRLTAEKLLNAQARASGSYAFDRFIRQASEIHTVPFPLIKAMIKAESNFNPRAVSHCGAKGLMQLMPINLKFYGINNPYDPQANIMGGTHYFKEMLQAFDGDLELALAAYNAGPQAVENYKSIPPYKETQDYVARVLNYYQEYDN